MLYLKELVFCYKNEDLEYTIPKEQQISFSFKSQSKEMECACVAGLVYGLLPPATYEEPNRVDLIAVTLVDDEQVEKKVLLPELSKTFQFPALDMITAKNIVKEVGKTYAAILVKKV